LTNDKFDRIVNVVQTVRDATAQTEKNP
jgi:hypothetical protein